MMYTLLLFPSSLLFYASAHIEEALLLLMRERRISRFFYFVENLVKRGLVVTVGRVRLSGIGCSRCSALPGGVMLCVSRD